MWWRRSWFSLKGKAGIPGQTEGRPTTSIGPRVPPVGSLQQRAVSHSMRKMEETLGVVLFERIGRGVTLSPEGEGLMRHTERVCRAVPQRGDGHAVMHTVSCSGNRVA